MVRTTPAPDLARLTACAGIHRRIKPTKTTNQNLVIELGLRGLTPAALVEKSRNHIEDRTGIAVRKELSPIGVVNAPNNLRAKRGVLGEGLIVTDAAHAGLELQRWLFPSQGHLLLPEASPAVEHLRERGYACAAAGTRLVLGPTEARPELLYAEPFGAL